MASIFLSDSEAFLIGLIAGEYASREKPLPEFDFVELLELRLRPFVPGIDKFRWVRLEALPEDAEEVFDGGYISEEFGALSVDDDGVFAIDDDPTRNSLTDLLSQMVEDAGNTNSARLLRGIAIQNDCETRFDEGEKFGKFLGSLLTAQLAIQLSDASSGDFTYEETPIAKRLEDSRRPVVDELITLDVVREIDSVQLALEVDRNSWCETFDEDLLPNDRICPSLALIELESSIQTFWLCIGIIFRQLYLQDRQSKGGASPLPRQFLRTKASTMPLLRAALDIAERNLHSPKPDLTPDSIVFHLVTGVEPLVRSLWDETSSLKDVSEILHERMRDSDPNVRKLASIANAVYRTYRNEAVHSGHKLHESVKTWQEAMYVYSAMRLAVDLRDAIEQRTNGANQS